LIIKFPGSEKPSQATGFLVDRALVLTAGHCVFHSKHGGWAQSIEIRPGANGTNDPPSGIYFGVQCFSVRGWSDKAFKEYDYGAIRLNSKDGENLSIIGLEALTDDRLKGMLVYTLGYPGLKEPLFSQWESFPSEPLLAVNALTLDHRSDTTDGNSGGPLLEAGKGIAVGIHTRGGCVPGSEVGKNGGTRLTPFRVERIMNEWRHSR